MRMADIGRSSFIPRETSGLTPNKIRRKRTFHVFGFVATAMLLGSLALGGGVYFLRKDSADNLASAKQTLVDQKSLFKVEHISEVREFDRRLKAAEALLQNHIAPLKIFSTLEQETKQRIQFSAFTLEHSPSRELLLTLEGVTPEFNSLALQEMKFGDNRVLKDIVFNQVAINEGTETNPERTVVFSMSGIVDLGSVRYDGVPVYTPEPAAFVESDNVISLSEATPAVLGEAVIQE
jgi:hypothetical protein